MAEYVRYYHEDRTTFGAREGHTTGSADCAGKLRTALLRETTNPHLHCGTNNGCRVGEAMRYNDGAARRVAEKDRILLLAAERNNPSHLDKGGGGQGSRKRASRIELAGTAISTGSRGVFSGLPDPCDPAQQRPVEDGREHDSSSR
jgi:hypothetical protein